MTDQTLDLLRNHNAAPVTALSEAEVNRREILLFSVLADATRRPARPRRRGFALASLGLGAALAGAAAFGIVAVAPHGMNHSPLSAPLAAGAGPLTAAELTSWTSTPARLTNASSLSTAAQTWCETQLNGVNGGTGTPTITNLDARGTVASMLYRQSGKIYFCISGGAGAGMWEVGDPAPATGNTLSADGILIDSAGSHGDGALGVTYAFGFVGSDVAKVTINEPGTAPIAASVQDGYWTAWWPQPSAQAHGGPSGTVSVMTKTGVTRTVSAESIYQK